MFTFGELRGRMRKNFGFKQMLKPVWLLCAVCFIAPYLLLPKDASGATGIRALDTPAITVKAPDHVVLIAIANAGKRLVAVGEHGVITYSDDNGQSWQQSRVPVDVTLTAVDFANPMDGWAAGHYGVILHTADGGTTWRMQLNGLQVNELTLEAAKAAVADNDQSVGAPLALTRANHFLADGPANPFLAILIRDPQNVMVFGAYRMVMKTTDGGRNWADWSLHVMDSYSNNLYDAAQVGADIYIVGESSLAFRSTDDGMTFPQTAPIGGATLFGVLPTGDGGVFAFGVAGQAFRSNNNGASWQIVNLGEQANLTAGDVLSSGAIVIGSESGNLYVSHNHAKTFSRLPAVQPMEIYGLTQASNGDVVVVGGAGVIVIPAGDFL